MASDAEQNRTRDLEIENKLFTVTRGIGERKNGGKKGKGQTKEHEQRTHGHGKWPRIDCGGRGDKVGESNREKGGATVTE